MSTLNYVNYNRKSSDSEDRQVLSIMAQEEFAQSLAERESLNIVAAISESKSAKVPNKRKELAVMLRHIKAGKYNAIICWKLDRLARNMVEGGEIIELLQQGKIQEIRTSDKTYLPNENAIQLAVEFGAANQYSRDLSNNVKRGLAKKAEMGIPGGIAPYGYINDRFNTKGNKMWEADPERFEITRRIFRRILEGRSSIRNVYLWAMREYCPTTVQRKRIGGKKMTESSFYVMLRNPVYAGFFHHAGRRYELHPKMPRAITEAQYWLIQRMLNEKTPSSRISHDAAYVGIISSPEGEYIGPDYKFRIRCDCGYKFSYLNRTECPKCRTEIKKMQNPSYYSYVYYYNVPRKKSGQGIRVVAEPVIEDTVRDFLSCFRLSPRAKEWMYRTLSEIENEKIGEDKLGKGTREARLVAIEKRKASLLDLLIDGVLTKEQYRKETETLENEIHDIQAFEAVEKESFGKVMDDVMNAYDAFETGTPEQKRKAITQLGSKLVWDEKNLSISSPEWILLLKNGLVGMKGKSGWFETEKSLTGQRENGVFDAASPTLRAKLERVRKLYHQDKDNIKPV